MGKRLKGLIYLPIVSLLAGCSLSDQLYGGDFAYDFESSMAVCVIRNTPDHEAASPFPLPDAAFFSLRPIQKSEYEAANGYNCLKSHPSNPLTTVLYYEFELILTFGDSSTSMDMYDAGVGVAHDTYALDFVNSPFDQSVRSGQLWMMDSEKPEIRFHVDVKKDFYVAFSLIFNRLSTVTISGERPDSSISKLRENIYAY